MEAAREYDRPSREEMEFFISAMRKDKEKRKAVINLLISAGLLGEAPQTSSNTR